MDRQVATFPLVRGVGTFAGLTRGAEVQHDPRTHRADRRNHGLVRVAGLLSRGRAPAAAIVCSAAPDI
jgi:hypothetical protein